MLRVDRSVDNLSIDQTGALWGAGLVHAMHLVDTHFETPSIHTPSSALRITLNKGEGSYFGEKYKVERVFEDDGKIASGSTSVAYDAKRKKLYLHGTWIFPAPLCFLRLNCFSQALLLPI